MLAISTMLNIVSLQALRAKTTGPGKVVKNLIKGLDAIGFPYLINADLNSCRRLCIFDDEKALMQIPYIDKNIEILVGPNINIQNFADKIDFWNRFTFLSPSEWCKNMLYDFGWIHSKCLVRAGGIDTSIFTPSSKNKEFVLVYFKGRDARELNFCLSVLKSKKIAYIVISYDDGYAEHLFRSTLEKTTYAIRIGKSESQGFALQEILAMNIPILVWDIGSLGHMDKTKKHIFSEDQLCRTGATSAPYFDERCGTKIYKEEELSHAIDHLQSNYTKFNPRDYIQDNLDYIGQAQKFLGLYTLPLENKGIIGCIDKKRRKNILIKIGFFLLDNQYSGWLVKKIIYLVSKWQLLL